MTYKSNGKTMTIWMTILIINIPIPENEPGINPGGISRSKRLISYIIIEIKLYTIVYSWYL